MNKFYGDIFDAFDNLGYVCPLKNLQTYSLDETKYV